MWNSVNETSTQFQLFEAGQLDYVSGSGDYIEMWDTAAENGECQLYLDGDVASQYMVFNTQEDSPSGITQNAKIRKALAYSLDSQAFIDSVYSGRYTPAYGLVTPNIKVADKEYRENIAEPISIEYQEYSAGTKC